MLKKFPSDKINGTKNALFSFASSNHRSFTFNLWLLHELKHKRFVSLKQCVGFSIFDSVSFLLKFIRGFTYENYGMLQWRTSYSYDKAIFCMWTLSATTVFTHFCVRYITVNVIKLEIMHISLLLCIISNPIG